MTALAHRTFLAALAAILLPFSSALAISVLQVQPSPHSLQADVDSRIVIHFDAAVDRATIEAANSFRVLGRWSGPVPGNLAFTRGDSVVTWTPGHDFSAGDRVMVILSHAIQSATGDTLRAAGFGFQFWTRTVTAPLQYRELQRFSTRGLSAETTRSYGGTAADLNGDQHLDLAIVNEDTADLRVFLNTGDKQGRFHETMLTPTRLGVQASPSETADFNSDGIVDLCVANIRVNTVSILLGNGDGSFSSQQITVGSAPRGITVLDAEADGDLDIINTNSASNNLSLLRNQGNGTFAAPEFFEGGGEEEWAVEAADFNHDGIFDLAVGAQRSATVIINYGVGDGSFVSATPVGCEGGVWMLNTGDVNGDSHLDVAVVNGASNNAAILLGDAAGRLSQPTVYLPDAFALATDLGDLDGDGDLDWITSSFGGDWFLYRNDGAGGFQFDQSFVAPSAASCALLLDSNGDGDLDLALIDEIADQVLILENTQTQTTVAPASLSRLKGLYR